MVIDTHSVFQDLKASGFSDAQAEELKNFAINLVMYSQIKYYFIPLKKLYLAEYSRRNIRRYKQVNIEKTRI